MKRIFSALSVIVLSFTTLAANIVNSPVPGLSVAKPNPYNRITSIAEDSDGMLWMGTDGDGLYQFDGTNYLKFTATGAEGSVLSSHINSILCDASGRLWIGTQKGINVFDKNALSFTSYPLDENNVYIRTVMEDPAGRIFISTAEGLLQFDEEKALFSKVLSFNDKVVRDFYIDENGYLFIMYLQAIEKYDKNFSLVSTTELSTTVRRSLFDGKKTIYFKDGRKLTAFDTKSMSVVRLQPNLERINAFDIKEMSNFGQDAIVFVTDNGHYCYYTQYDNLISESDANFPYNRPEISSDINLIFKGKNHLWAATTQGTAVALTKSGHSPYNALFRTFVPGKISEMFFDGQCVIFLSDNKELVRYNVNNSAYETFEIAKIIGTADSESLSLFRDKYSGILLIYGSNIIYEIEEQPDGKFHCIHRYRVDNDAMISAVTVDKQKRLWVSRTEDPNLYYADMSERGIEIPLQKLTVKPEVPRVYITKLLTLKNGDVLGAFTDIGLVKIDQDHFTPEYVTLSEKYRNMYIQAICEDKSGNIWIGTSDVGLFIYNPHTQTVRMPEQFEGKNISSIDLDDTGTILLSTEYTLYRYNENLDKFESVWALPEFITDQHLKIYPVTNGSNLLYSGNILFHYNRANSYIVPTSFNIVLADNNSNVLSVWNSASLTKKNSKIRLHKSQTTLSLVLGAPALEAYSIRSRYRISGLTKGWQSSYGKLTIPIDNLSYGRHKIDLQIINIEGNSYSETARIILYITRPWYSSIVLSIIYFLLIIIFIFIIKKQRDDRQKKILEAEILRREKEFQEKMNESNVDFFANMSHEFRTPLTIISGAAKSLSNETPAGQIRLQRIIRRNSERMLKLVSQMLDFNKLEHNELALNVAETDANQSIKDIVEQLTYGAKEKSITFKTVGTGESLPVWMDLDKFEKVMYNLLSNALKFTPADGEITVTSKVESAENTVQVFNLAEKPDTSSDFLIISVADNGIGIPEESLDKIFERFVQLNPSQKNSGTGIGLYFTKVLIELHHGFIKAENNNGALFTFAIPKDECAYTDEEKSIKQDKRSSIDANSHLSEYILPESEEDPSSDTRIMLIDDDVEIIGFLKSLLSQSYNVLTCFDALSGYKQIEEFNPDIIISDIMMVDMDGLQFCKMVKENVDICHIPIILLTAKDTVADQIKGLDCGAEAYIVKPFDPEVLLATVRSLLKNRENIKKILGSTTKMEKKEKLAISNRDKTLMDKLYALLEENIANPDMNIVNFAEELGVSRTKLFYKVKSLTGMTPSDFFTQYKLNRAIEYIKEDKYKIASIAEMCGFSSPSHFASLFKKHFGVLPREYINSINIE